MATQTALGEILGTQNVQDRIEAQERERKEEAAKNERIKRAKSDFGFFCKTYLPHYFTAEAAEYQHVLTEIKNTGTLSEKNAEKLKTFVREKYHKYFRPIKKVGGMVDAEPRHFGKSVRNTLADVLWRIVTEQKRYALIIGNSQTDAEEKLIDIKTELEDNEPLIEDFGDLQGKKWSDKRIELANGTCIQAKGAGASMRGTRFRQFRPDYVVLDDIMKDELAESKLQRDKLMRWFLRVVMFLGKNAFIVLVNTIFHSDDIINRLLDKIEHGELDDWIGIRFSCFKPNGESLWPDHWSKEDLLEHKKKVGTTTFSTEMENEPLSDEERIFHLDWFHKYLEPERPPLEKLYRVAGIDPATGAHDLMGILSLGVDRKTGIMWELDTWGKACSETQLVEALILKHLLFRYDLIGWENIAFQKIYKRYVMKLCAEKGVYLPIEGIEQKGVSKDVRIRRLSPLIENGIIRFREKGNEELIDQLWNFPKHTYDDLPDALEMAVRIGEAGPIGPLGFPAGKKSRSRQILRGYRRGR